ncbi:hypothetical protein BC751_1806 [Cecembia calidifontis]|jgi:hypothetical protein|uniref:Uncharacterized protein n=2 Tax=Cecembia TaxID=1187078 RepID=A0A4Q7P9N6_9BACT|nr:hypothetical protein CLV48_104206 [Cecembia rubra]RZS96240.1 hypothetical protein BC751_1806 [Cecembia calidifontis]
MKTKMPKRKKRSTVFYLNQFIMANTYFIGFEKSVAVNDQLSKGEPK